MMTLESSAIDASDCIVMFMVSIDDTSYGYDIFAVQPSLMMIVIWWS